MTIGNQSRRQISRRRGEAMARGSLAFGLISIALLGVVLGAQVDSALADRIGPAMLGAFFCALGLGVHGMALNDLLDLRRDLVLDPDRTLASGRVGPAQAALIGTGALIIALLGAGLLGGEAIFVLVVLAAGLLVHNAMARFIPAIGLLMPGLLIAGLSMLPGWPPAVPWLTWSLFTISVGVGLVVHLVADKRPRPSPRAVAGLTIEWIVVSVLLLVLPVTAPEAIPLDWGLLWPAGVAALLCLLLARSVRADVGSPRAADRVVRTTGVWCGFWAAAWCMAIGAEAWAAGFAIASVAAVIVLVLVRELIGQSPASLEWR